MGGGARGCDKSSASVPVGTCECTHRLGFEETVHIVCPQTTGNLFLIVESETVVPLLTCAASAPWRPSNDESFPKTVKFGGAGAPDPQVLHIRGAEGNGGGGAEGRVGLCLWGHPCSCSASCP